MKIAHDAVVGGFICFPKEGKNGKFYLIGAGKNKVALCS